MDHNRTYPHDADAYIAEIYDQSETHNADVQLIRRLISSSDPLQILEPFSRTGRILLSLAADGHEVTGIERSQAMIARARRKVALQPEEVQYQVVLLEGDALEVDWPRGCDLVILGKNCLNELATPQAQEDCIQKAVRALKRGGHLYLDAAPIEGELDSAGQTPGFLEKQSLSGTCADGAQVEDFIETIRFDAPQRLVRFQRRIEITLPDGEKIIQEFEQQKHLVSVAEVRDWLERNGFEIEQCFGDYDGSPYEAASPRAIFWAKKA